MGLYCYIRQPIPIACLMSCFAGNCSKFGSHALAAGRVFDAHAHLQLHPQSSVAELRSLSSSTNGDRVALMSVKQSCWEDICRIKSEHPKAVVAAYGVHPWFAHQVTRNDSAWMVELQGRLENDPQAIIGEIGLDKAWIPPDIGRHDWSSQLEVFEKQLELAVNMDRPASLHCVRCHGFMFEKLLRSHHLPPKLYLHSYTGSAAMVNSFVRMKRFGSRFYFGFSAFVNARSPKTPDVVRAIPADRILLESDLENSGPNGLSRQRALDEMTQIISEARGWEFQETLERTSENAERFYQVQGG